MKTKNKCQIGTTVFNKGIDYEVIIKRAEREYTRAYQCVECNSIEPLKKLINGDLACSKCVDARGLI